MNRKQLEKIRKEIMICPYCGKQYIKEEITGTLNFGSCNNQTCSKIATQRFVDTLTTVGKLAAIFIITREIMEIINHERLQ